MEHRPLLKQRRDSLSWPKPVVIGITGGTASGKTSLSWRLTTAIGLEVTYIAFDNFYKGLTKEEEEHAEDYNFDHPNAMDFECAYQCLVELVNQGESNIPSYNFTTHKRMEEKTNVKSNPIIVFEGIFALYDQRIRDLMDLKIFVMTDDDLRLSRRISRDILERGRTLEGVLIQYNKFVKKSYENFIKPTSKYADIIIPFREINKEGVDFITTYLQTVVDEYNEKAYLQ